MIFSDIRIKNFFSIGETDWINLKNLGLVLITGENKDSKAADSNGAGKSTLFEALLWVLWGKTTRGQAGDEVVHEKKKKGTEVHVRVTDGVDSYLISRYRKHKEHKNKILLTYESKQGDVPLTKGTNAQTQDLIDDILGIDYETFIRGPMLPQGSIKRISQLTDSEIKSILETALQVGVLGKAHTEIKDKYSSMTQRVKLCENNLSLLAENLLKNDEDQEKWREQQGLWLSERRQSLSDALKRLCLAQEQVDLAWERLSPGADEEAARASLAKIKSLGSKSLQEKRDEVQSLMEQLAEAKAISRTFSLDVSRLEDEITRLADLSSQAVCPTCMQKITEEHIEDCEQPILSLLSEARDNHSSSLAEEKILADKVAQAKEELTGVRDRVSEYEEKALEAVSAAVEAHSKNYTANRDITHYASLVSDSRLSVRDAIAALQENPATDNLDELKKEREELLRKIEHSKAELEEESLKAKHYEFWLSGFSNAGLKSHILATVTPYMNERARIYTQDLTDSETEIKFNTQTKLKSGDIKEKFSVEVTNINGSSTYKGNSGGEKARADLVINFTLSDVVASRAQKSYPQRWFDEPFESMDASGIEATVELLTAMVKECGTIFVVTHQPNMQALFQRHIHVVKNNGESKIVV